MIVSLSGFRLYVTSSVADYGPGASNLRSAKTRADIIQHEDGETQAFGAKSTREPQSGGRWDWMFRNAVDQIAAECRSRYPNKDEPMKAGRFRLFTRTI